MIAVIIDSIKKFDSIYPGERLKRLPNFRPVTKLEDCKGSIYHTYIEVDYISNDLLQEVKSRCIAKVGFTMQEFTDKLIEFGRIMAVELHYKK